MPGASGQGYRGDGVTPTRRRTSYPFHPGQVYQGGSSQAHRNLCRGLEGGTGILIHVPALDQFDADVVITDECPEWETFAYAHDANELGIKRAIIAVGHQPSEEPGMEHLTVWLRQRFPAVTVTHEATANYVASY
ncbi:MAG: hypothetical protein NVSMB52_20140 [Chloroflexota bacterium]